MPRQEPLPPEPNQNEPESIKQLRTLSQSAYRQQTPQVTPEMIDNAQVLKIYADFKWKTKIRDYSPDELTELMEGYILQFERELQTPEIRDKVIARFREEMEKQKKV